MKTIDTLSLETVTGGGVQPIVNPNIALSRVKLLEATTDQIAEAHVFAGLKLPSSKLIKEVRQRRF